MSYGYNRTLSVSDTASSSLDGVPLVVNSKYQPPAEVTLPSYIRNAEIPDIIYADFDFSLEEAVIESYAEQYRRKLAEEEAKVLSVGAEIEDFSRSVELSVDNDETCETDESSHHRTAECESSQDVVAKPQNNLLFNMSNDILLPTPIQPSRKLSPTTEHFSIDLTDFEREEDPFDKLELKTINTMEELKNVLQVAQSQSVDNAEQTDVVVVSNGTNCLSDNEKTSKNQNGITDKNSCDNLHDPLRGGRKTGARNVLPPIGSKLTHNFDHIQFPEGRHSIAGLESFTRLGNPKNSSIPQIKTANNFNPYSCYFQRNKEVVNINGFSKAEFEPESVKSSEPTLNPLRNALSTPDIAVESQRSVSSFKSPSPPPRPSSTQEWNRYSPLPNSSSAANSPIPNDPFCSLPIGQQEFVLALADMGFRRPQVARAVKKFGPDDKVVIDHLCLVNRIVEKGYIDEQAEFSLALFDNNFDKACEYLEMVRQFEELGFESDKIREALVLHSNNRDEALDFLTAA